MVQPSLPQKILLTIRASLFWLGFAVSTILGGLISPLLILFPRDMRYRVLLPWTYFNIWWLKITCGIKYQILGKENINDDHHGIVLANHQSTWETMMIPALFCPISWVLKKELFKIPFFGWGLSMLNPIAIDRSDTSSAMEQVKTKGKERLDQGNWICIFPEGTRVKPGEDKPFKIGGAVLAEYTGYPVYPVAHNAGECWPRMSFFKYPGTITLSIGKPVDTKGIYANEINDKIEAWIKSEIKKMPPARVT